jgi:signal transduction histidine kinase
VSIVPPNGSDRSQGAPAAPPNASSPSPKPGRSAKGLGLSAKLLLMTIGFVMLAEVLIFVPSVANFRINWLMDRLQAAQIASLAAEAAPNGKLPEMLREDLLMAAGVRGLAVKRHDRRMLVLAEDMPPAIDAHYDLREASPVTKIIDALMTYAHPDSEVIRVIAEPDMSHGDQIEVVMVEAPLRAAMIRFGLSILGLSLVISAITASLVYLALNWLLVRPMRGLTESVVSFAANPDDATRIIAPSKRRDELGRAQTALASMERELRDMLQQRKRLAALGLAVSKISHDLRNILASAQLISDRLGTVRDPTVERATPKLIASLDRAIRLCEETLRFGRASEPEPHLKRFPLRPLVEDVGEGLGLQRSGQIMFHNEVPPALEIDADPDQLHRILGNLCRNAVQVIQAAPNSQPGVVTVVAKRNGKDTVIDVSDSGPGIPEKAKTNLFKPFQGSTRPGGTGLGLAIAQELVKAHGGNISLGTTGPGGTTFHIELPDHGTQKAKHGAMLEPRASEGENGEATDRFD